MMEQRRRDCAGVGLLADTAFSAQPCGYNLLQDKILWIKNAGIPPLV
ncbi:MAG: hypothetical protein HUU50_20985 [Candidatus Brocadiae bacterium]|nr:hypothetical protein [Candidatus Brocadiia bacterium]